MKKKGKEEEKKSEEKKKTTKPKQTFKKELASEGGSCFLPSGVREPQPQ